VIFYNLRVLRWISGCSFWLLFLPGNLTKSQTLKSLLAGADKDGYVGSKACATCHSDIARTYATTPMANASGVVSANANGQPEPGSFQQNSTGAEYRILKEPGGLYFEYDRTLPPGTRISGKKRLDYFVGSDTHSRGYIFEQGGRLFQAPVAFYTKRHQWDVAPGYETEKKIFLGRQVEEGCLNCHASGIGLQPDGKSVSVESPFREGAIACERCHGPGEAHIQNILAGKGPDKIAIVNPAKLAPERRDSICAQCHLSGEARIDKPGKSDRTFRPGDELADHIVPFVWSSPDPKEFKVIGHFEGLWQSRCKRMGGDKLWCGTCHNPHVTVDPAQKAAYYREKCFTCHTEASFPRTASRPTAGSGPAPRPGRRKPGP
jgi:predicted CXXCH cytochrome family protein